MSSSSTKLTERRDIMMKFFILGAVVGVIVATVEWFRHGDMDVGV